jgi:hypothetical protein
MRQSSDQQSPHAFGIDESGPRGADQRTPPGISNFPTDDVLRFAGVLKEGSSLEGMTPDSLADVARSALTGQGFEDDTDRSTYRGDGAQYALPSTNEADAAIAPQLHDAESATSGFLGRNRLLSER